MGRIRKKISGLLALLNWYLSSDSSRHLKDLRRLYLSNIGHRRNAVTEMQRRYPQLFGGAHPQREAFRASELKVYSQCGEDGILLHLLSKVGVDSGLALEFGAGGYTSNIANLVLNLGWAGYFFDGDRAALERVRGWMLASHPTYVDKSRLHTEVAWITVENADEIVRKAVGDRQVDVLSIDIDGNDYWVWQAVTAGNPRVVVIEYNAIFGATERLSTPYDPAFDRDRFHQSGMICGASLAALEKLGRDKGYTLVCCDSWGVNAFFVRDDLAEGHFQRLSPEEAFCDHFQWQAHYARLRPELETVDLVRL